MRRHPGQPAAFTLIEVLAAAGLLFLLAYFGLQPLLGARRGALKSELRLRVLQHGRQMLQELRQQPEKISPERGRFTLARRPSNLEVDYALQVDQASGGERNLRLTLHWQERGVRQQLQLDTGLGATP